MGGEFHKILSQLRKSQRVSQRKVAADLYISQALLSHYENGIREPGLDFVSRACDYYGVSADYLLGRVVESATDQDQKSEKTAQDAPMDMEALSALYHMVSQLDNGDMTTGLRRCFGALSYRLLRHMEDFGPSWEPEISQRRIASLSDLEMRLAELQFLKGLETVSKDRPEDKELSRDLMTLLTTLDGQIAGHTH